ncbi:transglycosylase domain-containing protein [Alicyclobacillus cycloheptanicus]|uniref:Penicillin-binding protein/penicillin-binding protein 1A n=1 Tax=Alicyclobacillus cycloheptanicus TaxID=1457 RepID=A0ABT9XEN5_9BACL|nr:transglycosylase domain-containing protein [Alicyclobacillus cycloheptanicus]MDQ0188756.1 penicillin-binding protein/penicillin-binding protein 1A [Alicyclobacillus cycloheptanicus]WDM00584.1 transglycosylase domain-containing protein [Alicyclobacillus cycloheptanicus]
MAKGTKPPVHGSSTKDKQKQQRANAARKERRHPIRTAFKVLGLGVGGIIVIGVGVGIGYAASMLKGLPTISASTFTNESEASTVYDVNGKVIGRYTTSGDRQPITSVNQVSPYLSNALIAAEDKTFRTNIGINPLAMCRAFVEDVIGHHIQSGASTITQETVKLAVFPEQQRTLKRKIQEIALALELNHMLTKDEILTDYMNWVYMGDMGDTPIYGVKTASQILFHKDPRDLNIPQAALLAGIINNPSYFSPYQYPSRAVDRQHYVLNQMLRNHFITQQQYESAMSYNVLKDIHKPTASSTTQYPFLMLDNITPTVCQDLVKEGLYSTAQQAYDALPTAGYKIYTSIDLNVQNHVDSVLADDQLFGNTDASWSDPQTGQHGVDIYNAGVTIINNQTGGIVAIGGGRDSAADYQKDQIDHSDIARQPGSSIKPLIDYGPAIDLHKETAATYLADIPTTYPGGPAGPWTPTDAEGYYSGLVSVRTALVKSINVPAIRTLDMLTPEVGTSYLAKMGIPVGATTLNGQPTLVQSDTEQLPTAIGGMAHGLTVQQVTSAYTTFANQGTWKQSFLVSKIADRNGNTLYQFHQQVNQVFSPQTAWIMTNILHGVLYQPGGTADAIGARFPGYYISGKTGTTDSQEDGWFVGYTQQYTAGLWMGYNHHQKISNSAYNLKFTLWSDIMQPLLQKEQPTKPWPEPSGIVQAAVCEDSGMLPTNLCKQDNAVYDEYFIQGTQPTQPDNMHVLVEYTIYNGKKYLATTMTPPNEIRTGIFIKPPYTLPPGVTTLDSGTYVPTQPDPRGGIVLKAPANGQSPTTVSPPANVKAVAAPDGTSVQLTWNAVQGASGYMVTRATSGSGPYVTVAGPVTQTSFTDSQLPANASTLYYEVYAVSSAGLSNPSAVVEVVLPNAGGSGGSGGTGPGNGSGPGAGAGSGSTNLPGVGNFTGAANKPDTDTGATGSSGGSAGSVGSGRPKKG